MATAHPLNLHSLRCIGLRTRDFTESLDFYTRHWGLEELDADVSGRALLRGTGAEHHLLELVDANYNGIDHIAFAVRSPQDVDAAAEHLQANGVELVAEPGPLDGPARGYGLRMLDPEQRVLEISANVASNAPRNLLDPRPRKLAHVVLNTVDLQASEEYYREVLGFRVSDWSEDQMVFLRINSDHHSIAFNQGEWASVNHVAYELPSVDHYMRAIGRLGQAGIRPLWGPGRHGPGNNTFAYFSDPAGLVPEFTSEVEQIEEDDYLPRVWNRVADQSDLWGTAGAPSTDTRSHMAGEPDPGPMARDVEAEVPDASQDEGRGWTGAVGYQDVDGPTQGVSS